MSLLWCELLWHENPEYLHFFVLLIYMTSEAAVIIAVVVLLSLFVTVAVAVVSLADFDLYKAF